MKMKRASFPHTLKLVAAFLMVAALLALASGCSFLTDRQAKSYLQGFGWQVKAAPVKTQVTVPQIASASLADAYSYLLTDMGDRQPAGGLASLKGSKVTQYVYQLANPSGLPGSPARGFGIVWMLKGKVVAAWTAIPVPTSAAPEGVVPLEALQSDLLSVKGRLLGDITGLDNLAWLLARKAQAGGAGGAAAETVSYLRNGQTQTTDRQVLETFEMLRSASNRLPFAWGKIPMYVARYYTGDLTGIATASAGQWDDILAGSGLNVRINGDTVATYVGGNASATSVPLVFTDGRKGYFVELAPLGQEGLLVVSKVNAGTTAK